MMKSLAGLQFETTVTTTMDGDIMWYVGKRIASTRYAL
jgi:hypothetical protein